MSERAQTGPLNPLHWFPEFWQLGRRRTASTGAFAGTLSMRGRHRGIGRRGVLPGHAAGLPLRPRRPGRLPRRWSRQRTAAVPGNHRAFALVAAADRAGDGRPGQRVSRLHVRSGGRGARHGFGHRGVSLQGRTDSAARTAGEDPRQCGDAGHGRLRRPRRTDCADRRRLRFVAGRTAALAAGRATLAHGRRHGRRHRRHLPRPAGRRPLRRRGAVPLARLRVGSRHPRGAGLHHRLLHVRPDLRPLDRAWAGVRSSTCPPLWQARSLSPIRSTCSPTWCWPCSWSCWPCCTRAASTA